MAYIGPCKRTVRKCSGICDVRIPSGASRQHPYPFWPLGPKGSLGNGSYSYTTQVQPKGSGLVPHWIPVSSS